MSPVEILTSSLWDHKPSALYLYCRARFKHFYMILTVMEARLFPLSSTKEAQLYLFYFVAFKTYEWKGMMRSLGRFLTDSEQS